MTFPNFLTISSVTTTDDKRVMRPAQGALPFSPRILQGPPFLASEAQQAAADLIWRHVEAFARGSGLTTILFVGPAGAGKTRLLEELALAEPDADFKFVEASQLQPLEAFAEINRASASRQTLVLEGSNHPARWYDDRPDEVPPDLRSRLAAAPVVSLDAPTVDALLPVLKADVELHGHRLKSDELTFVAEALPRDFGAARRFCSALDRADGALGRRQLLRWASEVAHVRASDTIEGTKP